MTSEETGRRPIPVLPDSARDAIGRRLRQSLDRIVAEPVPDRFLRLLDALEAGTPQPAETLREPADDRSEDVDG